MSDRVRLKMKMGPVLPLLDIGIVPVAQMLGSMMESAHGESGKAEESEEKK